MNLLAKLLDLFVVYCSLPLFIFLLAFTLGLRDFNGRFGVRDFIKNIVRKLL